MISWNADFHCQPSVCLLFCCLVARGLWVKDLFRLFVIWTYSITLCFINLNLPSKSQKEQSNFENFNWPLQVQKGENQITEPLSAGDIPHRYKAWDGNVQVFAVLISAACTFGTGWAQGWLRAASQLVWLVGAQICSPEERRCAGRCLDARPRWLPRVSPRGSLSPRAEPVISQVTWLQATVETWNWRLSFYKTFDFLFFSRISFPLPLQKQKKKGILSL